VVGSPRRARTSRSPRSRPTPAACATSSSSPATATPSASRAARTWSGRWWGSPPSRPGGRILTPSEAEAALDLRRHGVHVLRPPLQLVCFGRHRGEGARVGSVDQALDALQHGYRLVEDRERRSMVLTAGLGHGDGAQAVAHLLVRPRQGVEAAQVAVGGLLQQLLCESLRIAPGPGLALNRLDLAEVLRHVFPQGIVW